jgi:hypothetical protein
MLYQCKLRIIKFLWSSLGKIIKPFLKSRGIFANSSYQLKKSLIARYVKDRTFIDLGCMWKVQGYFSYFAASSGASAVTAIDIYPETEKFFSYQAKSPRPIEFIRGDINDPNLINQLQQFEIVFASGLLYHMANPLAFINNLKKICSQTLILGTMIIPEINGLDNMAVFYPGLSRRQSKLWRLPLYQQGVDNAVNKDDKYSNWFWGFTSSCVESFLQYADFEIIEKYIRPFEAIFVARPK